MTTGQIPRSPALQAKFQERLRLRYGNQYDFSESVYVLTRTKTKVICPVHGEFWATPNTLLHPQTKNACPKCSREQSGEAISASKTKTFEQFVSDAEEAHGDWYDYSEVEYQGSFVPVKIVCPVHGPFMQKPHSHLAGSGCKKCGARSAVESKRITKDEFVKRAKEIHGDKFDYSRVSFVNLTDKIEVLCIKHQELFTTTAAYHTKNDKWQVSKGGCKKCSKEHGPQYEKLSEEEFLRRAREAHGNKYEYLNFNGLTEYVTVVCKEHGPVEQLAYVHLRGNGCPVCSRQVVALGSKEENEVLDFVKTLDPDAYRSGRGIVKRLELDIVVESRKLAIEYCGLYWHSDAKQKDTSGHGPRRHLHKLEKANEAGYRLLTIFADEWLEKPEIVKNLIRRAVTKEKLPLIGARKCDVVKIEHALASSFYDQFHLQGAAQGHHFGLAHEGRLVSLITVGTRSIYGVKKEGELEVIRFCTFPYYQIPGALARLCQHAIKEMSAKRLFSFVDRRWFTGSSYLEAGFELVKTTEPGYWYTRGLKRESRYKYAKHKLQDLLDTFNPALTEVENMRNNGWFRIFDCGQFRFELRA